MALQTITEAYAQLNRELHERNPLYGVSGQKHATRVMALRDEYEAMTALDFGCGKGTLKESLGHPEWMAEYDPAVDGKDQRPARADMVVCTDVLEHIEPDLLDNVLFEIARCANRVAYLIIATRPAAKVLADGTNAHKIVENADWWRKKLSERFLIMHLEDRGGEIEVIACTIREIRDIIAKSAVSDTLRYENAIRNSAIVKARAMTLQHAPRHERRICIVGFGPSLKDTWRNIFLEKNAFGAAVVSVSGAHDFLIERGIIPDIHIEVDPREHKAFFTRTPHPQVQYWIASCCHPKLIDNLVDHKANVALWHIYNSEIDFKLVDDDGPDPGGWLIAGGSGVGVRAINVMFTRGYRSFSLYGMDCSFAPSDGDQHAGAHSGKVQQEWQVRVGERWFRSSGTGVYMAKSTIHNFEVMRQECEKAGEPFIAGSSDRIEMFLHGDGLLQQMVAEQNKLHEVKAA
jgi:hypothetical protein